MKKTFLLLALMCSMVVHGQIGPIQNTGPKGEWIVTNTIWHEFSDDSYIFYIFSNNQFEDECVRIKLGNGLLESTQSIRNFVDVVNKSNFEDEFSINNYDFKMGYGCVVARHNGPLYYTAGDFFIYVSKLERAKNKMERMLNDQNKKQ